MFEIYFNNSVYYTTMFSKRKNKVNNISINPA